MRIVFDTNALLSATLWDGGVAQKLLFQLINSGIQIYSSKEILSEYGNVLKRDFEYRDNEVQEITRIVLQAVTIIEPRERIHAVVNDPEDNKILECAIASESSYVATYDKHLLTLKKFKEIRIITPEEALKLF